MDSSCCTVREYICSCKLKIPYTCIYIHVHASKTSISETGTEVDQTVGYRQVDSQKKRYRQVDRQTDRQTERQRDQVPLMYSFGHRSIGPVKL